MPASVYSSLGDRAARYVAGGPGREVFPFHVGDTWMEPAVGCRMEDLRVDQHPGLHRYGPVRGLPPLVDAIVERVRARTGDRIEPHQVLLTAGATGGLAAVVGAVVAPGEDVLLVSPFWPLIAGIVRTFSANPIPVPLLADGLPTPAEARAALDRALTANTAAVYLNTPNNPTGRVLPAALVEAIAGWAHDRGLWLIADEVYEDFVYDGSDHTYTRPLLPERTFAAYSFSKAYGMAGNRVGYVIGPAAAMVEVAKVGIYAFYSAPTASQVSALAALGGAGDGWIRAALSQYVAIGTESAAALGLEPPDGSTFLF
ncbi:MAG: pyridoxal phosphate-dependent aminotransferase, partial [Myxococcota bacterium]